MGTVTDIATARAFRDDATRAIALQRLEAVLWEAERLAAQAFPGAETIISRLDPDLEGETHSAWGPVPAMFAVKLPPVTIPFDGPGIYAFRIPARKGSSVRFSHPVAFLERAPERDRKAKGKCYVWQHRHKGKFQSPRRYVYEADLSIIDKLEAMD